jgi:hypothetical protein
MQRKVPLEVWRERATIARRIAARAAHSAGVDDTWTLSSSTTDLAVDVNGDVHHGPFDAPGPGTIKWLHHRLCKTVALVDDPARQLDRTLAGTGERVKDNGLGFDIRRFSGGGDDAAKHVDPVVETLAFFGLRIYPVRGEGTEGRSARARQRGWGRANTGCHFRYPTWRPPLTLVGIDALLDAWGTAPLGRSELLGITSVWVTEPYRRKAGETSTTAYGSRRES